MTRVRKLQDPALLRALEGALEAGEPLNSALARLGIHRSTLSRESKRDEGVRQRIERALIAGRSVPHVPTRPAAQSVTSPTPNKSPILAAGSPEPTARIANGAAEASAFRHGQTENIMGGAGRIAFGPRRPQPLARVRRIALHGARPRTIEPTTPRQPLALHDWLPAMLVLIANVALALATTSDLTVVTAAVLVVAAYVFLIRWLSHAPLASSLPARGTATGIAARRLVAPPAGTVSRDLAWLQGTIGDPLPGQRRAPPSRDRPRG